MAGVRGGHWSRWSAGEEAILETHYATLGPAGVAALLPRRSEAAVQAHAHLLGLQFRPPQPRTSPVGDFGTLVRGFREAANLNQSDVARALGIGPSVVGRWERSNRCPSVRTLAGLICALDLHGEDVEALLLAAAAVTERGWRKSA